MLLTGEIIRGFLSSLERQRQRSLLGDAGRYAWIWEGKFYRLAMRQSWPKVKIQDFEITARMVHLYIGVDWGFSVDPTAAIECYVF